MEAKSYVMELPNVSIHPGFVMEKTTVGMGKMNQTVLQVGNINSYKWSSLLSMGRMVSIPVKSSINFWFLSLKLCVMTLEGQRDVMELTDVSILRGYATETMTAAILKMNRTAQVDVYTIYGKFFLLSKLHYYAVHVLFLNDGSFSSITVQLKNRT